MMKIAVLIQTFIILFLPFLLPGFNISLSLAPDYPDCRDKATEIFGLQYFCPDSSQIGDSLTETEERKFIKDTLKGKTVYQIKTVVIDAGHGGHDPGCSGAHSREKHLALGVARKLAASMRLQFPDLKIIMTRDQDVFIPLHRRAAIANENKADLFISIHCNYIRGSRATSGTETYVMGLHTAEHNLNVAKRENASILLEDDYHKFYDYDPNSPEGHILLSMYQNAYLEQSIRFANKVELSFKNQANRRSRGVKQAGFVVLKETTMPSVLIETGFLSNYREEGFLRTSSGQELVAGAILSAFTEYKEEVEAGILNDWKEIPRDSALAIIEENSAVFREGSVSNEKSFSAPLENDLEFKAARMMEKGGQVEVLTEPRIISLEEAGTADLSQPAKIPVNNTPQSEDLIQIHVQLAAAPSPIDISLPRWQSIGYLVEVLIEDNLYKYQARNFSSLQQAYDARLWLQKKGFTDAFVVAYKNGKKISLQQARKELASIRP